MTKNQIEYGKLLESRRANRENEAQTRVRDAEVARHNKASETISLDTLAESRRANLAREGLQSKTLDETARHNVASEQLSLSQIQEMARHNVAGEGLQGRQITEQQRHNTRTESIDLGKLSVEQSKLAETSRHNVATEGIQSKDADTRRKQAVVQGVTGLLQVGATTRGQDVTARTQRRGQDIQAAYNEGQLGISQQKADTERIGTVFKGIESITNSISKIVPIMLGG